MSTTTHPDLFRAEELLDDCKFREALVIVTQVEEQITDRIAEMEIEDEVNLLVSNAIDSLNLD